MNKKTFRIIAGFLAVIMLLALVAPVISSVLAESSWKDEVYGYGAGLNEEQINTTSDFLEIKNKDIPKIKIDGKDTLKYLGEESTDSSMISSVYIKKNGSEDVNVEVTTPLSITKVSSLQYSNAAITAGLTGVDIKVAAIRPVTGESALAGVYKALEQSGVEVDEEKTKNANEEIQVINVIAEENKDKEGFSKEKLNGAVVEAKQQLVEQKTESGQNITVEEIENVVQTVIKDNNLQQFVNNVQIGNLSVVLQNFINSEDLDLEKVKDQLNNLASQAKDLAEQEMNKVKEFLNTDKGKDFVNSMKDSVSKENLQKYLDGAKDALSSEEVEKVLNGVKENINADKFNDLVNSAKDKLGNVTDGAKDAIDNAAQNSGGFFEAIGNFFSSIFKAIGDFFSDLF